jgi:hypothetical protein
MSGETDGGLTFGASISFRAGDNVDLDVGDLQDNPALVGVAADGDDAATGQLADQLSDINLGNIYVSGDFGKLTFDQNGIDNLMDDGFAHDVSFAGTFGALAVSATANIDGGAQAADGGDFSVKLAYSADGLSASVVTDDSSDYDATVGYALNDMITASVNYDTDGQAAGSETTVKVAYSSNGVSASLAMMDEDINEWAVALGYAANGMAINVAVDDGGSEDLTVSYDLGGGMTINAATNETGAFFVGSKMTF